tara:strand:+ start:5687 stop:7339 length:1653 start_codon:yes stop_codon:yes gene_type:complete
MKVEISRYFQTIIHLKMKQIYFQILKRIPFKNKPVYIHVEPELSHQDKNFVESIRKKSSMKNSTTYEFFGERGDIDHIKWNSEKKDKLWLYNLHYFQDLNAENYRERISWHKNILSRWIRENPITQSIGWDPYPLSLRAVNWIKWGLYTDQLSKSLRQNLFSHGLILEENIEYHIMGNHLFSNIKALLFLGCYFDHSHSDRWLKIASKLFQKQVEEQILEDGGHFELSPMYHALVLEDFLDLINLNRVYPERFPQSVFIDIKNRLPEMFDWLYDMSFDDDVSLFNDSSQNIASKYNSLLDYSSRIGLEIPRRKFKSELNLINNRDSGYLIAYIHDVKFIFDVARLGPDYLLAHGHADTLSFEMSLGSDKIFCNSGTSTYEDSSRRLFERSTKAHNTVEINNKSSSEVWKSFRVGRRAYPSKPIIEINKDTINIHCSHSGYSTIFKKLDHNRDIKISDKNIIIRDYIEGNHESAVARFILNSDIRVKKIGDYKIKLITKNQKEVILSFNSKQISIVKWKHATEFGELKDTFCIESLLDNGRSEIEIVFRCN